MEFGSAVWGGRGSDPFMNFSSIPCIFAVAFAALGLLWAVSGVVRISPHRRCGWWRPGIAAAVGLIVGLYRYEAGAVTPRRARWLVGLAVARTSGCWFGF